MENLRLKETEGLGPGYWENSNKGGPSKPGGSSSGTVIFKWHIVSHSASEITQHEPVYLSVYERISECSVCVKGNYCFMKLLPRDMRLHVTWSRNIK